MLIVDLHGDCRTFTGEDGYRHRRADAKKEHIAIGHENGHNGQAGKQERQNIAEVIIIVD